MNLYQLTGAAQELQSLLEAGEIDQKLFEDTLEGLGYDDKIENICKVIRNLEAQANAFKEEKNRLAEREKIANNGVKRLKESLLCSMQTLNKKKVDAGVFTITRQASKSVKIIDETWIPEEYLIYQPAAINKSAIAKALKDNVQVAGAELEESEYVRIR